jgi:hypothetical protein
MLRLELRYRSEADGAGGEVFTSTAFLPYLAQCSCASTAASSG